MAQLTVVTPPTTEPLTTSEVLTFCRLDASNQEPPPSAVTAVLASPAAAGNVDNGAHRHLATFVTADGETQAGEVSVAVTVADKAVNGKIALTGIPVGGAAVTARKLYRTVAGGSTYLLLATLADNSTTIYADNIADSALGAGAPVANTTSDPLVALFIKAARQHAETYLHRKLITQTLDLHLDAFPCWEICLPPLQSVTSITYYDTDGMLQTLAADQYFVDTTTESARITPSYGNVWPIARWRYNAVTVRFVAGYGVAADVPDCIKHWMMLRIKTMWDGRDQLARSMGMPVVDPMFVDRLLDGEIVRNYT